MKSNTTLNRMDHKIVILYLDLRSFRLPIPIISCVVFEKFNTEDEQKFHHFDVSIKQHKANFLMDYRLKLRFEYFEQHIVYIVY